MNTNIKTPRRRWGAFGAKLCMFLSALVVGVMFWCYGAVERGLFESEAEGLDEYREMVANNEVEWVDGQVAWIRLNDTHIDYPIMQASNNEWYLDHDYLGRDYSAGAVFLDCRNSADFSDDVMIIYGHRMNGDLMFSDVAKYANRDYFEQHKYGELTLRNGEKYDIVAVKYDVIGADDELYRNFWLDGAEGIVLSTCEKGAKEKRDILVLQK